MSYSVPLNYRRSRILRKLNIVSKTHEDFEHSRLKKFDDFIKRLMLLDHILLCFYTQIMHNIKIEYLCPGTPSAAHILNTIFSR